MGRTHAADHSAHLKALESYPKRPTLPDPESPCCHDDLFLVWCLFDGQERSVRIDQFGARRCKPGVYELLVRYGLAPDSRPETPVLWPRRVPLCPAMRDHSGRSLVPSLVGPEAPAIHCLAKPIGPQEAF